MAEKEMRAHVLTKAQRHMLERANPGPVLFDIVERKGGAAARMLDRLSAAGLVLGPPWRITAKGRAALKTTGKEG